mmetsp:Transcript_39564/g.95586  ORF Transcript_39564/g.95586 Transcript_39564/m.95586 type:complete len:123 (+) Transcript_39564:1332-1700(+)
MGWNHSILSIQKSPKRQTLGGVLVFPSLQTQMVALRWTVISSMDLPHRHYILEAKLTESPFDCGTCRFFFSSFYSSTCFVVQIKSPNYYSAFFVTAHSMTTTATATQSTFMLSTALYLMPTV